MTDVKDILKTKLTPTRFPGISRESSAELRTQLYIAARVEIISNSAMRELVDETKQISKMLYALGKSLKTEN